MSEVSSTSAQSSSSQTFITALVTNLGILALELVAFVILKHKLTRIYEPRTFLPPPEYVPLFSLRICGRENGLNAPQYFQAGPGSGSSPLSPSPPTSDVLHKNGLDAYMFLRFLRMLIKLFAGITLLTWTVILPIDAAGIRDANANFEDGLARLSWGNIPDTANKRYAAHILVVYITTFFTFWLIRRELFHYAEMRQAFLVSKSHSQLAQARTVLITSIPLEMCNEHELRLWSSFIPGGIQNIWVYRDTTDLNKHHNERLDVCKKLEAASVQLIEHVNKAKRKEDKRAGLHTKMSKGKESKATGMPQDLNEAEKGHRRSVETAASHGGSIETMQRPLRPIKGPEPFDSASHQSNSEAYELGDMHSANPADEEKPGENYASPTLADHSSPTKTTDATTDPIVLDEMIQRYVPPNKRPHHRLGFLGLWGKKVDTIEWCKDEIARLNKEIEEMRAVLGERKPMGSAFIQCNLQLGAHVLAQCVSYHTPLMMSKKFIEIDPKDVIWDNIDDGVYETRFRYVTSWLGSLALIAIWFLPVAFVGTLSNVTALCEKVSWLCWIKNAPTPIPGIIQGILPPMFLAILFAILPFLLKGLAWYENIPRWTMLSMSVYKRYYLFLVIHGFLVVTLSSSITATASHLISNPTQAVSELASQLPSASIFFLTWTITQGLTGAGSALLQVGVLFMYFVKKFFLGRTPRQAYRVTFRMPKADFGLVLPRISLLATIALAYSVLSPVINGLAMVAFTLFFFAWKFLLTWVFDQPEEAETGGQYFPLAINFLFTGLYIEQFCLAVLFFLKISDGIAFIAEGVLMIVLMVLTVTVQILFKQSFDPITENLPMSLATKKMQERWEHDRQKRLSRGQPLSPSDKDDEMDMFSRSRITSVVRKRIRNPVLKLKKGVDKTVAKTMRFSHDDSDDENASRPSHPSSRRGLGIPTVAPAAPGLHKDKDGDGDVDSDDGDEDLDFDENGFNHPSMYTNQPWIWLPKDDIGVSERLVTEFKAAGVEASDVGAFMDAKGNVEVQRNPPDEDWAGGHDA
ncbi:hypothetical protein EIP91_009035 [Steccherinum ochraceum]|uniref:DUF221-domain-containing protein n=1 Tax=Steccherinum ochraceum TaxID=92696 RepID=A0A4R0RBZ1_9APHY|nr:hypothetical protein EIP91_009035 [Steccherinum ochraceum]